VDRFELVMARLQIAVQAKKKDLELQLQQYDEREKRLAVVLDALDSRRRERETERSSEAAENPEGTRVE
jgi:hypothetical protein